LKAQKIDNVDFCVHLVHNEQGDMDLVWRHGELFLALSGVFLNHSDKWYELPLTEIKGIRLKEGGGEAKLLISVGGVNVVVKGRSVAYLRALRHLLLPYITNT